MSDSPPKKKRKSADGEDIEGVDILGDSFKDLIKRTDDALRWFVSGDSPYMITIGPRDFGVSEDNLHVHIWLQSNKEKTLDEYNSIVEHLVKKIDNPLVKVTMTPIKEKRCLTEKVYSSWELDEMHQKKKYSEVCHEVHAKYKSEYVYSVVLQSKNQQKFNCYCEIPHVT